MLVVCFLFFLFAVKYSLQCHDKDGFEIKPKLWV